LLTLDNKDQQLWNPITGDGINGVLRYNPSGDNFDYSFTGVAPVGNANYSLIYAKDPWPQTGSLLIGSGNSDPSGAISLSGPVDLGTDLPATGDANTSGAKIWLVLSSDFNGTQMTGWHLSSYLLETHLIQYDDTNN